jgi:hypothetical protein
LLAEPEPLPAPVPLAGVEVLPFDAAAEPEPAAEPADGALSAVFGALSANETMAVEVMSEPAMRTVLMSFVMAADTAAVMPSGSSRFGQLLLADSRPKATAGHIADPTRFG